MYNGIIYSLETGLIYGATQIHDAENIKPNEMYLPEGVDPSIGGTHYVLNGVLTERPLMNITKDGLTLKGIPENGVVFIKSSMYTVIGGEATFSFNYSGKYNLRISCFPYQDYFDSLEV